MKKSGVIYEKDGVWVLDAGDAGIWEYATERDAFRMAMAKGITLE